MRTISWFLLAACLLPARVLFAADPAPANTLSDAERREGWRLLWDGKTTEGWRGARLDSFPTNSWKIQDGVLSVVSSGNGESAAGGDIITADTFSNFELVVDFRETRAATAGSSISFIRISTR
ncbi:MAG: DUF1080 domain-containing protein [Verrucomicrobiota bacterium]